MKPLLIVCGIALFFITYGFLRKTPENEARVPVTPTVTLQPTPVTPPAITFSGMTYAYGLLPAAGKNISLIPNFEKRLPSETLLSSHSCTALINGGFYDTTYKPLGYFFTDGKEISPSRKSALFNGYISVSDNGIASISADPPDSPGIALQSGPILMQNTDVMPLKIIHDEHARRMIAAVTAEGAIVFITVYNPESVFEGPLLGDLPVILRDIAKRESIHIEEALNLDGGSASAFYTATVKLSELTPVGSVFCIKSRVQ